MNALGKLLTFSFFAAVVGMTGQRFSLEAFAATSNCVQDSKGTELCLRPGKREGAFVLQQTGNTSVLVASFPADPDACPAQRFNVRFDPFVEPPNMRSTGRVVVSAPATACSPAIDVAVELPKSEFAYALNKSEFERKRFTPRAVDIPEVGPALANQVNRLQKTDAALLEQLRKAGRYDSLSLSRVGQELSTPFSTGQRSEGVLAAGKPCAKARSAKLRTLCNSQHAKALVEGFPFVSTACQRCQVSVVSQLRLVATKGATVSVIDNFVKTFGPLDSAAKAALATDAESVAPATDGSWIVRQTTVGGTCAPYEYVQIYETIDRSGRPTASNAVVVDSREACA